MSPMDTGIDPIIEQVITAAGGTAMLAQRLGIQATIDLFMAAGCHLIGFSRSRG